MSTFTNSLAESIDEVQQQRQDRPSILCIDDDPEITRTIELRLHEYEVKVDRAFHGMQGFWLAMTERPKLIITDMRMPNGEGDYVVECLKRNSETRDIPIVVLTGNRDPHLLRRMKDLGVVAYLTKPCRFEDLLGSIQQFVELKRKTTVDAADPPAGCSEASN